MAIASLLPLASQLCLRRSLISSTHQLKPIGKTIRTPGMCSARKYVSLTINMCLRTTVSEDDDAIQRRTGNHHLNLWDDDFIQSLSTPYGASYYRERADRLIGDVKDLFSSMSLEDGDFISPVSHLLQRLLLVDNVERLGIDRHFKTEIKATLDYVYRYVPTTVIRVYGLYYDYNKHIILGGSHWNEKGIGYGTKSGVTDLNSTALGLRILRLHGYTVSSDVLEQFKEEKAKFACSAIKTEGEIKTILNLFRASLIAFPGEKVMEEAEIFAGIYLKEALQKIPVSSLSREIEYVLEYGWHTNLPRLEARNYIDVFGHDPVYQKLNMKTDKLLELAKLEFNIFHSIQLRELKHVSRWWKDLGFSQLPFSRHRHVEYYTLASCIDIEPKHSAFRIGFAKLFHVATVLDDIYDTFGTMDELQLFTTAVKRWHPSATESLPEYMKLVYMVFYETVNEMAREAEKSQGRDTLNYARQAWEAYVDADMNEAKWNSSGYLPTFEEYLDNGKVSFGYRVTILQPILTLDIPFPHHILQQIDFPSRLNGLACSILRLKGDTRSYEAERLRGEEVSSISCYMRDNPGSTEEDALAHINALIKKEINELNWELLKPDCNVPISSKKYAFDFLRALCYLYKYRDGFSVTNLEVKNLVTRTVLESIPIPM